MFLSFLREEIRGENARESKEHEYMTKDEILKLLTPIKEVYTEKIKLKKTAHEKNDIIISDHFDEYNYEFSNSVDYIEQAENEQRAEKYRLLKLAFRSLPVYCDACGHINENLGCRWTETTYVKCTGTSTFNPISFQNGESIYSADETDDSDPIDSDTQEFEIFCQNCEEPYEPLNGYWHIAINNETANLFIEQIKQLKGIKTKNNTIEDQFTKIKKRKDLEYTTYQNGSNEEVGLPLQESMEKTL